MYIRLITLKVYSKRTTANVIAEVKMSFNYRPQVFVCPRGGGGVCLIGESQSRGEGSVSRGGLCSGGSLSGGEGSLSRVAWLETPASHCSGRYASYWNAFLFFFDVCQYE